VLLIETAERLRVEGMERLAATRRAAELRLRPRLMITLPVSLGFVPLAFALEPGGELLRPLAAAAIGGLLAAVLVALYLVPVLYTLIGSRDPAPRPAAGIGARLADAEESPLGQEQQFIDHGDGQPGGRRTASGRVALDH
jgi:predicted exporter